MRISDWSSDVCSSDLEPWAAAARRSAPLLLRLSLTRAVPSARGAPRGAPSASAVAGAGARCPSRAARHVSAAPSPSRRGERGGRGRRLADRRAGGGRDRGGGPGNRQPASDIRKKTYVVTVATEGEV